MRLDHMLEVVTETAQDTRPAALPLVTVPLVTVPLVTVPLMTVSLVMGMGLLRPACHTVTLLAYA
jgi:hypothetical protein